jgi:hypothetical protein
MTTMTILAPILIDTMRVATGHTIGVVTMSKGTAVGIAVRTTRAKTKTKQH